MHHSWCKFTYMLFWTFYDTPYNKKLYQVVNKKGVEVVHYVCLSCCFDVGLDPYHGTRGTPVKALDNTIITYNDR